MTRKEILENRIRSLAEDLRLALCDALRISDLKKREEKAYEAQRLRKEIESYGYMVQILHNAAIDPKNLVLPSPAAEIKVGIWQPKRDIPPEEQKKYDAWFLHIAGICGEEDRQ